MQCPLLHFFCRPEWSYVSEAVQALKAGQVIGVPTETIYGIAADLDSTPAISTLYHIKCRELHKPIAICLSHLDQIELYGELSVEWELLKELLPGPVTVCLKRTGRVNPHLNPNTDIVGIRIPDYPFVCNIASALGRPIALTSANISSQPSSLSIHEFSAIWPQLGAIFDAGILPSPRSGSTVVDLSNKGYYTVLREGQDFEKTVKKLEKYGLRHRLS